MSTEKGILAYMAGAVTGIAAGLGIMAYQLMKEYREQQMFTEHQLEELIKRPNEVDVTVQLQPTEHVMIPEQEM